jgi:O-antigen/teichoic acid export membrane protein
MGKKSYASISFVSVGNILNTVLGFLFLTVIARSLSLEDFGRYALLTSLLTFLAKGTDFGTNSLYVSTSITSDNKELLGIFYSLKALLITIFLPVALAVLLVLHITDPYLIGIFIFGLVAYGINFTMYSLFQKHEQYSMLILVNSIIAVIKFIFATLIFFNVFIPTLTSAFAIFSLSVYPSLILIVFLPTEFKKFKLSIRNTSEFLKEAFPAGISLLVSEGWSSIANIITKFAKSFSDVGLYSLADKLSAIFSLISFSIFTVLLPKNSRRKKENKMYDFKETTLIASGILLLACIGVIASKMLVVPIFGENFRASLPILYILLFASALTAINTFMENYFFVEKKTTNLLPISLTRLISFVGISFVLLPIYSINGIAWASLISSLSVTLIMIFIFKYDMNKQKHIER